MKGSLVLAATAALALGAAAALAQEKAADAPAAKRHVNKVTPEARAMMEKHWSLVYSPVRAGLKEMAGKMRMAMEMEGMEGMEGMGGGMPGMDMTFDVKFKAPNDLVVKSNAQGFMAEMAKGMTKGVESAVRVALGIFGPEGEEEGEYDADVVEKDGRKVLHVTTYENDVEQGQMWYAPSAAGLFVRADIETKEEAEPAGGMRGRKGPGGMGMGGAGGGAATTDGKQRVAMDFTYEKTGDLHRTSKIEMTAPSAPGKMEYILQYVEAGGFQIGLGWKMTIAGMEGKFGYEFTELSVNGKPVELPKKAEGKAPRMPPMPGGGEDEDGGGDE